MEADVSAQSIAEEQSARSSEKADAILHASIDARRELLARLHGLRATGRIALELDPAKNVLPAIVLEDGDEITVPTAPSFVGVFGSVTAETSFVYRFEFTVRDYLNRAGLTRDADPDFTALIRADGTVETNSNVGRSWLTGWSGDVMDKRLNPGDSIFVPEKFDKRSRYARFIEGAKDWTSIFYQFGLGAAGLKVLK